MWYLITITFTLLSCEKHPTMNPNLKTCDISHSISKEAAINTMYETITSLYGATKGNEISIDNIQAICYEDVIHHSTKSNYNGDFDTILYVVNYCNDNGYAILAADDRFPEVLAITERGNYIPFNNIETKSTIEPQNTSIHIGPPVTIDHILAKFVNFTISNVNIATNNDENIDIIPVIGGGGTNYKEMQIESMITTKWDQGSPYNNMMPLIENTTENSYTGCGVIAIAQVLTYMKDISLDEIYNITEYEWDDLEKTRIHENDPLAHPISKINYDIFIGTNSTNYEENGTLTWPKDIARYLKNIGYSSAYKYKGYNEYIILSKLNIRKPVIISALSSDSQSFLLVSGHTWIIDGVDRSLSKYEYTSNGLNEKYRTLFHCNWGWGGLHDGYYLSDMFDAGNGPVRTSPEDDNDYDMLYRIVTF